MNAVITEIANASVINIHLNQPHNNELPMSDGKPGAQLSVSSVGYHRDTRAGTSDLNDGSSLDRRKRYVCNWISYRKASSYRTAPAICRTRLTPVREFLTKLKQIPRFAACVPAVYWPRGYRLLNLMAGAFVAGGALRVQPKFYNRNVNVEAKCPVARPNIDGTDMCRLCNRQLRVRFRNLNGPDDGARFARLTGPINSKWKFDGILKGRAFLGTFS